MARMQEMARTRQNADFFLAHVLPFLDYLPDLAALKTGPPRVIPAVGEDSAGQLCHNAGLALASGLATTAVRFPGGHSGFLTDPAAFADKLHEVLQQEPGHGSGSA